MQLPICEAGNYGGNYATLSSVGERDLIQSVGPYEWCKDSLWAISSHQ